MKKLFLLCALALILQSCASIFTTTAPDQCQRCRPQPGEPKREIRWGFFVLDALAAPFTGNAAMLIDFGNNKIYKPCSKGKVDAVKK